MVDGKEAISRFTQNLAHQFERMDDLLAAAYFYCARFF